MSEQEKSYAELVKLGFDRLFEDGQEAHDGPIEVSGTGRR